MITTELTYEAAMQKAEAIIRDIENNRVTMDELPEKIKEVAEYLRYCKEKLTKADAEVQRVLEEIKL